MKTLFLSIILTGLLSPIFSQLKIGDKAPNFNLKNIDNSYVSLDKYRQEKGVVLVFTCNHCPYAKLYEDRLVVLDKEFKPKGFPVIALNPNNPVTYKEDSFDNMIVRAREKGFTFPYLVDNIGIYKKYGATKTPHIYLLKKEDNGFIVKYIGAIDDNPRDSENVSEKYLVNAINLLLQNKDPLVAETKAIGCSIKPY
ncbi:thioredoxin family protein [Labilibacter sediminis]|nr:thioredoxin family protein [Labilibacter sediminis]